MTTFNDYEKIKKDVENNVMARLHPILKELQDGQKKTNDSLIELNNNVGPMVKIFQNANGFNRVIIGIMKVLGLIGVAIGGIYAFLELLKRIAK